MVEDHHEHIVDEDPLLISQSLTYVTDDGSVLHSFQSAPFSWGMCQYDCLYLSCVREGDHSSISVYNDPSHSPDIIFSFFLPS